MELCEHKFYDIVTDTRKLVNIQINMAVKSLPLNCIDEALIFLLLEGWKYFHVQISSYSI